MATTIKVTFTLDEATGEQLRRTAARVRKPQSQVVREAIGNPDDFHDIPGLVLHHAG